MKHLIFITAVIIFTTLLTRCSDPCDDVVCMEGECMEGICFCSAGYEGIACDTQIRTKYFGVYEADLSVCFPEIPGGQLPPELSQLAEAILIAGPGPTVLDLNLSSAGALVNFDENISVTTAVFNIPENTLDFNDPDLTPIPFSLTVSGLGELASADTILMDLVIVISTEAFPVPLVQNCELDFIKN